jgi:glycerate 2-kinase
MHMPEPASLLRDTLTAAVKAVTPGPALVPHLPPPPKGRLVVVGAGKAAAAMAQVVESHYEGTDLTGLVITRYGHSLPTHRIEVVEAGHPVPDEAGERATQRLLELVQGLTEDDLVLCLISGGGSALLAAPKGITLQNKAALTKHLLASGADITEMNTVRKHLSGIKGGQLARAAAPARVLSLIISDVAGDDLSSIASGPTVPDPTTFQEALNILDRYGIDAPAARGQLERGARGEEAETPKGDDPIFERVDNRIVASAQTALEAAASHLQSHGIIPLILTESLTGEAGEAAKFHAAIARQVVTRGQPLPRPCALLSGGETTVTVRGNGKGGRNSEYGLALALELRGLEGVWALAADTDGIDGSEDNAGVMIGPHLFEQASVQEARSHLDNNDAYSFFARTHSLLVTGPTHTNVNDLRVLLIL